MRTVKLLWAFGHAHQEESATLFSLYGLEKGLGLARRLVAMMNLAIPSNQPQPRDTAGFVTRTINTGKHPKENILVCLRSFQSKQARCESPQSHSKALVDRFLGSEKLPAVSKE